MRNQYNILFSIVNNHFRGPIKKKNTFTQFINIAYKTSENLESFDKTKTKYLNYYISEYVLILYYAIVLKLIAVEN